MTNATQQEDPLQGFIESLPGQAGTTARSVANAWRSAGGHLAVGHVAVRLMGGQGDKAFTAATIHHDGPRLELCRVILGHHGVDDASWTHWSDGFTDFAEHGFQPTAKYPSIDLAAISPTELARLVTGMRDLARLVPS